MAMEVVGIVDYNNQVHCMEHAYSVSSYRDEIYSADPARFCWCGAVVGTSLSAAKFIRMNDGIKGEKAPPRRLIAKRRRS